MATRILVFGTGSIGAVYTWVLSKVVKESDITAICRSNYDEASTNGFTIHSGLWGNDLKVRPQVARSVADAVDTAPAKPYDYVLVAAKAIPTVPSTAELIRPAVGQNTTIVLLQNGIGIEDEFAKLYPDNPLLSTVVYLPATQVSPGVVYHKEVELLHVGTYPATAPAKCKDAGKAFVDLLGSAGASARLHDDVQFERWSKLLVNGSWNPICALTRLRDRQFIDSNEDALQFIKDAMMEVAAVAQACGYSEVNEKVVEFQINRAAVRSLPGVQPSMLGDALHGRTMEVDALVGNTVRLAKQKGTAVPMLRTIYFLVNGLGQSFSLTT
ncbi:2-dehydropantoate 2-reductase [Xylariaceae sp. FL0662B]|nr:2-dehydropantoate 2-reductase [Xylariaceae sp. FL0662B]